MAKHPELTDEFLHVPGYIQPTDPGAVGGGMLWVDTAGGPGNYALKIRNDANTAWEAVSGGGGVNIFTALVDTPAAYAGAANYKVVVNGTETGLVFVPDSGGGVTVFTGLTDTPVDYTGAAGRLVVVNSTPDGLEFVDGSTLFLPLVGGIMTGDIQFQDLGEGIEFNDGAGAYFDAIKFEIVTDPEIVIGALAPDVGGNPFVRANTGVFRIGEGSGAGFGLLEMWNEDGGSWIPIIDFQSNAPGDPLLIGSGDNALDLQGSETRPTYNGGEDIAFVSDLASVGGPIKFYNPGVGNIKGVSAQIVSVSGSGSVPEQAVVRVSDIIRSLDGGAAVPFQYSLQDVSSGLTFVITNNGGTDPENVYITYQDSTEWAGGMIGILWVKVDDGVNAWYVEIGVNFNDTDSIGGW